jgi:hypothetical protein
MNLMCRRAAALACLTALPALAGAEEMTVVSRVTLNQGAPQTSTQYIGEKMIRTTDGENDTIVDVANGRYTVVNHKKKEYYEFTRDEMMASMQQLEQQMAGPMGAMMEKMMGGKVGEVTVTKGAARKVAGYGCTAYTVSMGENMRYELCATEALSLPSVYYDALKGPYAMMGPMSRRFVKVFEEMKKIKGFPVAMNTAVSVGPMKIRAEQEATEIRKGAIPASSFAVPAGYKKKNSPFKR